MSTEISQRVLITGGTGSFGQAMARFLLQNTSCVVVILSRGELLQAQMKRAFAEWEHRIRYFIGDVRDRDRIRLAMDGVDIVFHAAALKHVGTGEYNPDEMVKTNILGTMNVIHAARDAGVKQAVLISTDKSVAPLNVYGSSKGVAEKLWIQGNSYSPYKTAYCCVRYGNVHGSRGSVGDIWRQALREGQSITVTDLTMTRFFITLQEAVNVAWSAATISPRGSILVPHLPAYSLEDLFIAMQGLYAKDDIEVQTIGVRIGEKYHEDLLAPDEQGRLTIYSEDGTTPIYYCVMPRMPTWEMPPIRDWPVQSHRVRAGKTRASLVVGAWYTLGLDPPYNSGTWPVRLTVEELQERLLREEST